MLVVNNGDLIINWLLISTNKDGNMVFRLKSINYRYVQISKDKKRQQNESCAPVGTNVRTSWQQELWGSVVASGVGGRATTGVYIDMEGSACRLLLDSTESRYDLWKLLKSSIRKHDTTVKMTWRGMIQDQS